MARTDPQEVLQRFESLKSERSSWESMWRDLCDFVLPDAGNFNAESASARDGDKRYGKLLDAEATHCADILAAGLLTGVSSPSRPWLRLTTLDQDLDNSQNVKEWLARVEELMLMIFAKAEVYNQLHQSYLELPVFGTSCTLVKPHPTAVISLENLTVGEYYLADDEYGRIDTLYRSFVMTAKQMVATWGLDAVSRDVRQAYNEQNPFKTFEVVHAIEPRFDRDLHKHDAMNMPFRSVYFDPTDDQKRILSESGFKDFPALCPRWFINAHAVYGRGPGAKCLSAAKRLQQHQERFDLLLDYATDPPMTFPMGNVQVRSQLRPGGRVPVSGPNDKASVGPVIEARADLNAIMAAIEQDKNQIRRFFHADTFQMIAQTANADRTATEVAALEQEKIMMLGPVLSRLHSEMLDPMVSNTFALMVERNMVPPVPEELQGRDLNVEYISILAKQQKSSASQGVGRFIQTIASISQIVPTALDKLDVDKAIDHIADYEGVPPDMVVAGDQVAIIRKDRQRRMSQQQALEQGQMAASTLKDLGQATSSGGIEAMMQQNPELMQQMQEQLGGGGQMP